MSKSVRRDLLLVSVLAIVSCAATSELSDCADSENPIACRSVNFLSKAFNQVVSSQGDETLKLLPGLEIVQNDNINAVNNVNDVRSMAEQSNESVFTRIAKYLQTHDLKIKFADMIGKTDLQEVINNVFNNDDPAVVGKLWVNAEGYFGCRGSFRSVFRASKQISNMFRDLFIHGNILSHRTALTVVVGILSKYSEIKQH